MIRNEVRAGKGFSDLKHTGHISKTAQITPAAAHSQAIFSKLLSRWVISRMIAYLADAGTFMISNPPGLKYNFFRNYFPDLYMPVLHKVFYFCFWFRGPDTARVGKGLPRPSSRVIFSVPRYQVLPTICRIQYSKVKFNHDGVCPTQHLENFRHSAKTWIGILSKFANR